VPLIDRYREQAGKLVWAAGANAMLAYKPILDQHPHITSFGSEKWQYYLTVAGVYAAIMRLVHDRILEGRDLNEVLDVIEKSLAVKFPDGPAALEECRTMVDASFSEVPRERDEDQEFAFSDRIGAWILYRMNGPRELKDGHQLIRNLGLAVTSAFASWWS
jgi:hypothetical protein